MTRFADDNHQDIDPIDSPALINAQDLGGHLMDRISGYIVALDAISQAMIDHQEKRWGKRREGNVLLRFNDCGYGCLGCPHPRWYSTRIKRVTNPEKQNYGQRFLSFSRLTTPGRASKVKNDPELRELVARARRLIENRSKMVSHATRLHKHLSMTEEPVFHRGDTRNEHRMPVTESIT